MQRPSQIRPSSSHAFFRPLAILAAAALGLSALPAEAQKVLRHQFRPGEPRELVIDQDMKVTMSLAGQNFTIEMKQEIEFRNEVAAIEADGNARVHQRVTRVKMTSSGVPGANFAYDSDAVEEPEGIAAQIAPIFRTMLSGNVQLTMTPQGEIRDVELPKEMLEAAERASGLPGVADLLSKESLTQMMKQSGVVFPIGEVSPGDAWTETAETKSATTGRQIVKTTYTYLGEEEVEDRRLDKIGVAMEMEFMDSPEGTQLKITEQKSTGALHFDNAVGELVKSNMDQLLKMDVVAGENAIQQTLETKIKVSQRPEQER
jgi:glycerophosphoryl diester phosphodiesterase